MSVGLGGVVEVVVELAVDDCRDESIEVSAVLSAVPSVDEICPDEMSACSWFCNIWAGVCRCQLLVVGVMEVILVTFVSEEPTP
ncbi:MAG: hypothetical protein P4L98_19175 [Ancalomicrobiaceae bacterium]|nr:hypothetical protein [Ancalomicrobiaceae bacterium]